MTTRKTNRPHHHCWALARGGRMFYRVARSFSTKQACSQWAKRNYGEKLEKEFMVRQCENPDCAPKLD